MTQTKRYWEIDFLRACGLVLMVVQHSVIVWNAVTNNKTDASPLIDGIGHSGALIFIILVGVSAHLSYTSAQTRISQPEVYQKFLIRGLKLLGLGLVVSVASLFVVPGQPIYFGVLHFIGCAVILMPVFIETVWLRRILMVVAPVLSIFLKYFRVETLAYISLGIFPQDFTTLDYWPLVPWITVPMIGVELGQWLYPNGIRRFLLPQTAPLLFMGWLSVLGRHTLILYLIHIPVIFLLVSAFHYLVDY